MTTEGNKPKPRMIYLVTPKNLREAQEAVVYLDYHGYTSSVVMPKSKESDVELYTNAPRWLVEPLLTPPFASLRADS